jgi:DNA-binding transcriptional LysR family regulator
LDFQELRAFDAVARNKGISAAAGVLGLSKSAVSMQITRLEERLGTRLVERNSRRVALTREGEQLLPRIQSILADADQLIDETMRMRGSPRGAVRIAVPPALGAAMLERLIPSLAVRHPGISLVVAPSYDIENVQDPAIDLAVRVGRIADEGLVGEALGSFRRILVCSPDLGIRPTNVAMLAEAPLLAFSGKSTRVDWRLRRDGAADTDVELDCEAKVSVRDFDLLLRLVRAGQGITMVPEFMVREDLARGRLRQVLPKWGSPPVEVLLAYRVGASRITRIAAVLQDVRRVVGGVLRAGT